MTNAVSKLNHSRKKYLNDEQEASVDDFYLYSDVPD